MLLSSLLKGVKTVDKINYFDCDIEELSADSREVFKNCLYFAIKGNNLDGNHYIEQAVERGAVAVVTETPSRLNICQIIVKDVKTALSKIAKNFYKQISPIKVIGVVGTNGKTTTSFMVKSILESAGHKTGVIGTLGAYYDKAFVEPELTTPNAIGFYELLYKMSLVGVEYAVVELSAHAIYQRRLGDIYFECLIFTNCTRDHLDYFKTFEDYERTKLSVFNQKTCRFAVVNADDASGRKIISSNAVKTFTYGLDNPADVFAININNKPSGVSFVINAFDEISLINYKGTGRFNVYNALAGATACSVLGAPITAVEEGLRLLSCVTGRMEYVETFNGASVFIDYAHTPDGLENLLKSMREITKGKLILVFGCGGNRDKEKRPIMGEIAGKFADFSVITSDNPRYEEPYLIISEIERGLRRSSLSYITIQNRKMAIGYALTKVGVGDTLVVAGKGAEEYQEIMGIRNKFSDREEIKEAIAKIKFGGELF